MWIVGAPRMRFLRGAFVYVEEPTRCIDCLLCRPVAQRCALRQSKWCSQQGAFFYLACGAGQLRGRLGFAFLKNAGGANLFLEFDACRSFRNSRMS